MKDNMFNEFAEFVKENYGMIISKSNDGHGLSFEDIFGVSTIKDTDSISTYSFTSDMESFCGLDSLHYTTAIHTERISLSPATMKSYNDEFDKSNTNFEYEYTEVECYDELKDNMSFLFEAA